MKLSGLNAIVTGASQGLGKAIAAKFLRNGANVAICARDASLLAQTRDELAAETGGRVLAHPCDVSNEEQVVELTAFAIREFGTVHALVSNAGRRHGRGCANARPAAICASRALVSLRRVHYDPSLRMRMI